MIVFSDRKRIVVVAVAAVLALAFAEAALTDNYQYTRTAQDDAKAAAMVLHRSDIPQSMKGLKGGPTKPDETPSTSKDICDGYLPKQSDLQVTGDAQSKYSDTYGVVIVVSAARIFKTAAMAATDWKRESRTLTGACLRQALARERTPREALVSMTRLHTLRCGCQNASHLIELTYQYAGKSALHYMLVMTVFRFGRTEASVMTFMRKMDATAATRALIVHGNVLAIVQPRIPAT